MTEATASGASRIKPARVLRFSALWRGGAWLEPAYVAIDGAGCIVDVSDRRPPGADTAEGAEAVEEIGGFAIPGFLNAHSHAFQYAMAGLAEHLPAAAAQDDFWSWREAMYKLAGLLTPDTMEAVAAMAYAEMARQGFTAVLEFHYLHHDPDGRPYANLAEMGERLMAAAETAGLHLTLAPVLYRQGGFGKAPTAAQRRFLSKSLDDFDALRDATRKAARGRPDVKLAAAAHSLRAVSPGEMTALLAAPAVAGEGPLHIHVAEQRREVEECLATLARRPVAWVLEHAKTPRNVAMVHATHLDDGEVKALAQSGATVVVCPSTEGNLGDGFFPLTAYAQAGGRGVAIGTDSHIGLSALEELRWLDYGQRMRSEKRNPLCTKAGDDSGTLLVDGAWRGGRGALGFAEGGAFAPGQPFDAVVVEAEHPVMVAKPSARRLSALLYGGDASCFVGVMRRGVWVVERGRHRKHDAIRAAYRSAIAGLTR